MLPTFPKFKKLESGDREVIEMLTKDFLPYSDFNFTSLWCWDVQNKICISNLNGNLVVKFTDYITGEPFFSFIGANSVNETSLQIIDLAKNEKTIDKLKLLPQELIKLFDNSIFNLEADINNSDYVLSIQNLKTYKGNKFGPKRNFVNRFKKIYNSSTKLLDLSDKKAQINIFNIFSIWSQKKGLSEAETQNELMALSRIFEINNPDIISIGIFIENKLIAFSINEIVNSEYAILHFEKGDLSYIGLFPFLMQETANLLSKQGVIFLNYEQDLGLPGLHKSKLSYNPAKFLQKYTLSLISKTSLKATSTADSQLFALSTPGR